MDKDLKPTPKPSYNLHMHTHYFFRILFFVLLLSTQYVLAKNNRDFDIKRFHTQAQNNEVTYTTTNGNQVRETATPSGFVQREYDPSGVIFYREFNKDGKIQKEGRYAKVAKQEIPIGQWTTYNSRGNVLEVKNNEEGFQVTFDQVMEICQKRKINLTDRLSSLTKSKPGERPMWVVGWNSLPPRSEKTSSNNKSPTTKMEVMIIDGVTGDIKDGTPYTPFKN